VITVYFSKYFLFKNSLKLYIYIFFKNSFYNNTLKLFENIKNINLKQKKISEFLNALRHGVHKNRVVKTLNLENLGTSKQSRYLDWLS